MRAAMIVSDRRIRGLGQPPGYSHVHVRVIDRSGHPLSGVKLRVSTFENKVVGEGETNGDGFAIIEAQAPMFTRVNLSADLPEGTGARQVETTFHASGRVEVFQSVTTKSEPVLTLAEALSFGAGILLTGYGLSLKDGKAEEVMIGLGTGFAAISGFSLIFRHLR